MYRRKIASALTTHRFGKDLVARTTAADCALGECTFVTQFIPGEKVENDEPTRLFLGQLTETFAEAGLGVWQINPRNPHAHTNLIRNPDGDLIIIDLESAVVTPIPAPGQWRAALRSGNIPIFDDIDFGRLRTHITDNEVALQQSLGSDGLAQFREDVDHGEEALRSWQDSEPRIWIYSLSRVPSAGLKSLYKRFTHMLKGADRAAENFLDRGIERWESEGRLSPSEAAQLRSQVSSEDVQNAMHHMGVHLVECGDRCPYAGATKYGSLLVDGGILGQGSGQPLATSCIQDRGKGFKHTQPTRHGHRLDTSNWSCFLSSFASAA